MTRGASKIPEVSVVIPAYNAERWIARTLASATSQSIWDIEIIVVDDGSKDATAEIVKQWARTDPRILLLQQMNEGVASARNTGIAAARAEFVAPLDADDIWHASRLAAHLAAFRSGGGDVALVYSPYRKIDADDRVFWTSYNLSVDGSVFEQHLCENIVGNGSGVTMRTKAVREAGGYSTKLRDAGAEGAEDWVLQLRLAYRYRFARAPGYLVGYRNVGGNMSSNSLQMKRSSILALREVRLFADDVARPVFWWPQARACGRYAYALAERGQWREAIKELAAEAKRNPILPLYLPFMLLERVKWRVFPLTGAGGHGPRLDSRSRRLFHDFDPLAEHGPQLPYASQLWIRLYRWIGEQRLLRREAARRRPNGPSDNSKMEQKL